MFNCLKKFWITAAVFAFLFIFGCSEKGEEGKIVGGDGGEIIHGGSGQDGELKVIEGIECVFVEAGTFVMGSPAGEEGRGDDEMQHQVTLTNGYWISKYPVTNVYYYGQDYKRYGYPDNPVVYVNWYAAKSFSESIGARLPTEAQWEFAARGGNKSRGYIYSGSDSLDEAGYYWGNIQSYGTQASGKKKPNELGICDMSGNVYEWCGDWYGRYPAGPLTDAKGSDTGSYRVVRGGSWGDMAKYCRVAYRDFVYPSDEYADVGFRVVFIP